MPQENLNGSSLPDIRKLISAGVTVSDLAVQLYRDYSIEGNPEKAYLAIRELLDRGPEGRASLLQMSHGTDELSKKVSEVLSAEPVDNFELESILGIKRFGQVCKDSNKFFEDVYGYLKEKGQTSFEFDTFVEMERRKRDKLDQHSVPPQILGTIDEYTINTHMTFGVSEPGYLELWGPKDLLKLKECVGQKMALLGSLGAYSAKEFRKFAKKITQNPETFIIEVDSDCVNLINQNYTENKVIEADARRMPFPDGSFDQIYTNYLFHHVRGEDLNWGDESDVVQIIKEAARVLKSGGTFLLMEKAFGEHQKSDDVHQLVYNISSIGQKAGLRTVESSTLDFDYVLRSELDSAKIDENGFPHYEDSLLSTLRGETVRVKFVKN